MTTVRPSASPTRGSTSPSRVKSSRMGRQGGAVVTSSQSNQWGVGSSNRRADQALIQEMKRFSRGETFDQRPRPDLDSEAVDFRVASELFAPIRKLRRRDLETLRLLTTRRTPSRRHPMPTG
jgi:predicted HTH transcriptional regulator